MNMKLLGKVAVITGAGSGIGRATAILFAKEGAKVTLVDINEKNGKHTLSYIETEGGGAFFLKADVSKTADVKGVIERTVATHNKLDILCNNAGIPMSFTKIEKIEEHTWNQIMNVNVKGIFLAAKYAAPVMKKLGGGVILNTASVDGVRPRAGLSAYATSHAAVIMLTKAMAIEFARYNIRVNVITPGVADTPMLRQFMSDRVISERKYRKDKKAFIDSVPLGRLVEPEDVAYTALFLASDEASLITGAMLNVDGGRGI